MARRKSTRSKASRKNSSRFTTIAWAIITAISGGGIGGYFNPDLPVLGPLLQGFRSGEVSGRDVAQLASEKLRGQAEQQTTPNSADGFGGQFTSVSSQGTGQWNAGDSREGNATFDGSQRSQRDGLLIATFNIQVFGQSKLAKSNVVDILAKIVRQFDVVAIQEVRAKDDDILPRFVAAVNADGSRYDFIIGPRLGRSVSTEQYAFVYDTSRVQYDSSSVGTMADPADVLHREPFVARFMAHSSRFQTGFSFWMINIHTDPDEVPQEVDVLADAFQIMQSSNPSEDDVILLGDLNANENQLGRIKQIPGMTWVVRGNVMTNTRQNKAYDNILFDQHRTAEFTGRWGVIDIEKAFGLSRKEALQVSDHLPVWAEFDRLEKSSGMADRILGRRR